MQPNTKNCSDRRTYSTTARATKYFLSALPLAAALALGSGATPAHAISGESPETTAIFTADFCGDADVLLTCTEDLEGDEARCDLLPTDSSSSDRVPGVGFCAGRDILLDLESWPETGAPLTNIQIDGMSQGWVRALQLQGSSDVVHVVNQTFDEDIESVRISPAEADNVSVGDCTLIDLPVNAQDRASFCTAVEGVLPFFDPDTRVLRFVAAFDYRTDGGASNFGTGNLTTLWTCPGFAAQCVAGNPIGAVDPPLGVVVLDQGLPFHLGLSDTWTRTGTARYP